MNSDEIYEKHYAREEGHHIRDKHGYDIDIDDQNKHLKEAIDEARADEREKQVFLNIYSNMPSAAREEVIVIIEGKPFSWNASYLEIRNDTELGRKILDKLSKMKLI